MLGHDCEARSQHLSRACLMQKYEVVARLDFTPSFGVAVIIMAHVSRVSLHAWGLGRGGLGSQGPKDLTRLKLPVLSLT